MFETFFNILAFNIVSLLVGLGLYEIPVSPPLPQPAPVLIYSTTPAPVPDGPFFSAFNPAGGLTYRLQSSVGTTDTTINLSSFQNRSELDLTMINLNTDIGYGTISPQTSRSEFVSFTGITQNSNGTAQLTGVKRGISDLFPYTASTTLRNAHAGQSIFILSDSPALFDEYTKRRSEETITGLWIFASTSRPIIDSGDLATSSTQLVTKQYVDTVTNQGAATSTETNGGIVELATLAEVASTTASTLAKPLVVQAEHATSTPTIDDTYLAMSENDGFLHQDWLDLNEEFVFASTTADKVAATDLTATGTLKFGNTAMTVPSVDGIDNQVLRLSGASTLVWENFDWELLASTTATAATTTFQEQIPKRTFLKIHFFIAGKSVDDGIDIEFNLDTGNNYARSQSVDIGAISKAANQPQIRLGSATSTASYSTWEIYNRVDSQKLLDGSTTEVSTGASAPTILLQTAVWNNTSERINNIQIETQTGTPTFSEGSQLLIYGSSN